MSTQNSLEATLVGGWTPFHPLTAEDKAVFDQAMKGFVGVKYTPQSVSTQVVAGKNYRFKCTASMPPAEVVWEAIVEIFQPLNGGAPYITGIIRL
ncbi:hypothetical protein [Flavobacterium sp. C4GT6]|uniref:hypothetical protein n=1 Tax=Flavobacterium sp. C4GT6 TaxID=3103818 RepID=UPI002ED4E510